MRRGVNGEVVILTLSSWTEKSVNSRAHSQSFTPRTHLVSLVASSHTGSWPFSLRLSWAFRLHLRGLTWNTFFCSWARQGDLNHHKSSQQRFALSHSSAALLSFHRRLLAQISHQKSLHRGLLGIHSALLTPSTETHRWMKAPGPTHGKLNFRRVRGKTVLRATSRRLMPGRRSRGGTKTHSRPSHPSQDVGGKEEREEKCNHCACALVAPRCRQSRSRKIRKRLVTSERVKLSPWGNVYLVCLAYLCFCHFQNLLKEIWEHERRNMVVCCVCFSPHRREQSKTHKKPEVGRMRGRKRWKGDEGKELWAGHCWSCASC